MPLASDRQVNEKPFKIGINSQNPPVLTHSVGRRPFFRKLLAKLGNCDIFSATASTSRTFFGAKARSIAFSASSPPQICCALGRCPPCSQPMRTISTSSAGCLEQPNIRCRDIPFCVRVAGYRARDSNSFRRAKNPRSSLRGKTTPTAVGFNRTISYPLRKSEQAA